MGILAVLTADEEQLFIKRLLFCASRGAALGYDSLQCMIARIALNGRPGFKNGTHCQDKWRACRARYPEMKIQAQERIERPN